MIKLKETIEVNRPVEEVFDYIVNLENVQRWQPAVIEVRRLTEGPTRLGTRFSEVVRFMGRRDTTTCEVVELERNSRFAFKATGRFEYETTYTFGARDGGTRIEIDGSFKTKGFWRVLEPILKGELQTESRTELQAMKKAIETRTP
jgi:uncharacterized protein YndB with AHSA1/START domain